MLALVFEARYCIGCFSCEVACKQERNLPSGPRLVKVLLNTDRIDGSSKLPRYELSYCRNCAKAPCIESCHAGAMYKDSRGIIAISEDKCTGCMECLDACPFGIPQFHPVSGTALLCDLCKERLDRGEDPACVKHCPAEALKIMDINIAGLEKRAKGRLFTW